MANLRDEIRSLIQARRSWGIVFRDAEPGSYMRDHAQGHINRITHELQECLVLLEDALNAPNEKTWLEQALDVTLNSREGDYGHPAINFLRVADDWNAYLRGRMAEGEFINPVDVALMMAGFKRAREIQLHKPDNGIDHIGYISCHDRIDRWMRERGYTNGAEAFRFMNESEMTLLRYEAEQEERQRKVEGSR